MRELPVRNNIRLKGYDYSRAGYYFITICVKNKHEMLGRIVGNAHPGVPTIELSEMGKIVKLHIDNIASVYNTVIVDKYVIMPNHIHMIIVLKDGTPGCASPTKSVLAKTVNALKSLTSRQCGASVWQRAYHDHIIRDKAEYQRIWQYIDENPIKWQEDRYYIQGEDELEESIRKSLEQSRNEGLID